MNRRIKSLPVLNNAFYSGAYLNLRCMVLNNPSMEVVRTYSRGFILLKKTEELGCQQQLLDKIHRWSLEQKLEPRSLPLSRLITVSMTS